MITYIKNEITPQESRDLFKKAYDNSDFKIGDVVH